MVTSLQMEKLSLDASKAVLKHMDKWLAHIHKKWWLHKHNKTKHNKHNISWDKFHVA